MGKMKKKMMFLLTIFILVFLIGCTQQGKEQGNIGYKKISLGKKVTLYKSQYCGCCGGYADYLKSKGYEVEVIVKDNIDNIKNNYNIPQNMRSCHTSVIGDYFVEGHVPVEAIEKLLSEKPNIKGIALPNMPPGSPGMGGSKRGKWDILAFNNEGNKELFISI